jgi:predicted metal-binding membrane protein
MHLGEDMLSMTEVAGHDLSHLSPAAGRLGGAFARPKTIAIVCVGTLAGAGWFALGLLMSVAPAFDVLCRSLTMPNSVIGFSLVALMWGAMTLAMMLPSAAPMILTYSEIADTAARKDEPVVSPFVIAAGYAAVWFGFAIIATVAQLSLMRTALIDSDMASASALFSGAIFIAAGVYQFSELKHACLRQCQQPFPFFFANWKTTPRGVFRLGVRQGLYCLGCCWAMMLVMFVVGIMNVVWMATLGMVMTVEKMGTGKRFTHAIGVALIAAGVAFVLSLIAARWPGHMI